MGQFRSIESFLKRTNFFLKLISVYIDSTDSHRTLTKRLKHHWGFLINILLFNFSVGGQYIELFIGLVGGKSFIEITYLLPCLTLCMLGNYKIYYFLVHVHHANDIVVILKKLELKIKPKSADVTKNLNFVNTVCNVLLVLLGIGVVSFAIGPIAILSSHYYKTNEFKFTLPFMVWYPFDACDIKYWPFIYVYQMWCAGIAVLSVYGPDCFFLTCCAFINLQFVSLHDDWKNITTKKTRRSATNNGLRDDFILLVDWHRELIRCVELLEEMYSKSTLFNVLSSSLIICATGFNLMAIDDFVLLAPFISFIIFGLLQIFFYCYYGDCLMRSSMAVGDGIYGSRWMKSHLADRKYFSIALLRTQKPCQLTAYGFTVINLRAFTKILSTSWSYFALLKQMYGQR